MSEILRSGAVCIIHEIFFCCMYDSHWLFIIFQDYFICLFFNVKISWEPLIKYTNLLCLLKEIFTMIIIFASSMQIQMCSNICY